jgi:Leucine zipper with capping helix domain
MFDPDVLFAPHPQLDIKEIEKLQGSHAKAMKAYNERKRMCMRLIEGIMEGYPKSKQKLIEDTEIETDEAAGFDVNQYK